MEGGVSGRREAKTLASQFTTGDGAIAEYVGRA